MDNMPNSLSHSVPVTKLVLTTGEGVVALFLNITYIVVFCTRSPLRNQTNSLNVGLALSSIELAVGFTVYCFLEWYKPSEMYWLLVIIELFYYQVRVTECPFEAIERFFYIVFVCIDSGRNSFLLLVLI